MLLLSMILGCEGGKVSNEADAELAYLGLDGAVARALALGLDGFNAASSANIDPQSAPGDTSGTLTVTGQVDQGSSDNKGLRLELALDDYSDTLGDDGEPDLLYETDPDALPSLDLQLRDIPDGTLQGTLVGTFAMDRALTGLVALDLALDGTIEDDGAGGTRRVEGETRVTGTATSDYGTYEVDLER